MARPGRSHLVQLRGENPRKLYPEKHGRANPIQGDEHATLRVFARRPGRERLSTLTLRLLTRKGLPLFRSSLSGQLAPAKADGTLPTVVKTKKGESNGLCLPHVPC